MCPQARGRTSSWWRSSTRRPTASRGRGPAARGRRKGPSWCRYRLSCLASPTLLDGDLFAQTRTGPDDERGPELDVARGKGQPREGPAARQAGAEADALGGGDREVVVLVAEANRPLVGAHHVVRRRRLILAHVIGKHELHRVALVVVELPDRREVQPHLDRQTVAAAFAHGDLLEESLLDVGVIRRWLAGRHAAPAVHVLPVGGVEDATPGIVERHAPHAVPRGQRYLGLVGMDQLATEGRRLVQYEVAEDAAAGHPERGERRVVRRRPGQQTQALLGGAPGVIAILGDEHAGRR